MGQTVGRSLASAKLELDLRDFDTFSGERAKGIDVHLTMGWGEPPDLVHKRVAASVFWVVATPDYLTRHGTPRHSADMQQHQCLLVRNTSGKVMDLWPFREAEDQVRVAVSGWTTVRVLTAKPTLTPC